MEPAIPGGPWDLAASTHSARYREFCKRLQAARAARGLTQRDVAAKLGRPPSFVAKVESGERRLDVIELDELAALYGRTVEWFIPPPGR